MNKGIWYAIGAYVAWGLLPVYWKWLREVPALQLISHRIVWSFLMLIFVILLARQWPAFRAAVRAPHVLRVYLGAAVLLGVNWLTYVWAVNAGFIVETSLGYFINPLLSVLLGVLVLHERLRPWQWVPIGLATAGVLFLTLMYGSLPWIALTLAGTFGLYGLIKKTAPLGSLHGLTLETGILLLPALLYLLYAEVTNQGAFLHVDAATDVLLVGSGLVTTLPLLLFAGAAQRIPLSLVGILQYIAPTLQFLLGVGVYGEPFTADQFVGFGLVWAALIIFGVEGFLAHRAQPVAVGSR
ncbi:MAG: EamA family transporter RarD [Chloroflexi bacterium]|nr:EamA family transporter RarD [Chloroflexota bacterium]MBU1750731.1 EamA family transporter RarD [Chloroflexota bacterium]MBU1879605.1 EamA family transporter RarD [Chloroflexota bacterium]